VNWETPPCCADDRDELAGGFRSVDGRQTSEASHERHTLSAVRTFLNVPVLCGDKQSKS
jgi:hypothetical protein